MASRVEANPKFSLEDLNQFLADIEEVLEGPLTDIGHDNVWTLLTIDSAAGKPPKASEITLGAKPVDATLIGTGQVYIKGILTNAAAYKPA
jgi:hypothetical protein